MNYDIIILGAGPGGYVAAIKAAQLGAKVAIIEKQDIGGVCLNIGCIPTKALLKSAKVYQEIMNAEEFGIIIEDKKQINFDWEKIIKRKDKIVKKLTTGIKMLLKKNNVDVFQGLGKIINANQVEVNNEILTTKNIIIATGSSPIIPTIPGVKEAYEKEIIVTSKELLSIKEFPNSLVVIGGGVIGIEFATLFAGFGAEVTIIEMADNILVNLDEEIRDAYLKILKKSKINIITNAKVTKINYQQITYDNGSEEITITGDKILLSVGMKANTDGLEHLKLAIDKQGIITNQKLETNIPGVYAIGDVNGKMMLAHVASSEGIVAVENIMGKNSKIDYQKVPAGIYGSPEIAHVGLTEQQAKARNLNYKVSKFPLAASGKALAEGETEGFIKVIVDQKYGELLGMHILANHATDLISEAVVTMELEGTVFELAKAIHPHPTLSEIIMEAAHGAIDKPIHI